MPLEPLIRLPAIRPKPGGEEKLRSTIQAIALCKPEDREHEAEIALTIICQLDGDKIDLLEELINQCKTLNLTLDSNTRYHVQYDRNVPKEKQYFQNTPVLSLAVMFKNKRIALRLLELGAKIDIPSAYCDHQPLHFALSTGSLEMAAELINRNAPCHDAITWVCLNRELSEFLSLFPVASFKPIHLLTAITSRNWVAVSFLLDKDIDLSQLEMDVVIKFRRQLFDERVKDTLSEAVRIGIDCDNLALVKGVIRIIPAVLELNIYQRADKGSYTPLRYALVKGRELILHRLLLEHYSNHLSIIDEDLKPIANRLKEPLKSKMLSFLGQIKEELQKLTPTPLKVDLAEQEARDHFLKYKAEAQAILAARTSMSFDQYIPAFKNKVDQMFFELKKLLHLGAVWEGDVLVDLARDILMFDKHEGQKFQDFFDDESYRIHINELIVMALKDDKYKQPLLFKAGHKANIKVATLLLEFGADPNALSEPLGDTPLHAAVYGDCPEIARLLLNSGAKLIENRRDLTPVEILLLTKSPTPHFDELLDIFSPYFVPTHLMGVLKIGNEASLKYMFKKGYSLTPDMLEGAKLVPLLKVLFEIAEEDHKFQLQPIELTLSHLRQEEQKKYCNMEWDNGISPLTLAVKSGHVPLVKVLMKAGAVGDATALKALAESSIQDERVRAEMISLISPVTPVREKPKKIKKTRREKESAPQKYHSPKPVEVEAKPVIACPDAPKPSFYEAVCNGDASLVREYITRLDDNALNLPHSDGNTVFHLAVLHEQTEILELLLRCDKIKLSVKNKAMQTPLELGIEKQRAHMLHMILKYRSHLDWEVEPKYTHVHFEAWNRSRGLEAEILNLSVSEKAKLSAQKSAAAAPQPAPATPSFSNKYLRYSRFFPGLVGDVRHVDKDSVILSEPFSL